MSSLSCAWRSAGGAGLTVAPASTSAARTSAGTCSWSNVTTAAPSAAASTASRSAAAPSRWGAARAALSSVLSASTRRWSPSPTAAGTIMRASWPPPRTVTVGNPGPVESSGAGTHGAYGWRRYRWCVRSLYAAVSGALALVVREGVKFGVVGAVAYVVDTGLFNLLLHLGREPVLEGKPLTAKVVSVCVATLVAWLGNRYWTFRRRRRSAVRRELVLFVVVNVGGLLLALVPLAVSRYVLGYSSAVADNIAANVIGLALGTLFRFLMYRTVVFNQVAPVEEVAAPQVARQAR